MQSQPNYVNLAQISFTRLPGVDWCYAAGAIKAVCLVEAVLLGGMGDRGGDWIRFIRTLSLNSGSTVSIGDCGRVERYRRLLGAVSPFRSPGFAFNCASCHDQFLIGFLPRLFFASSFWARRPRGILSRSATPPQAMLGGELASFPCWRHHMRDIRPSETP